MLIQNLNKSDMNDLNQLNSLGQQGLSEYQDVLGKISGMNQLGVDKWLNTQDELNQRRERFEEERNQEWPQGSGSDIVKYNVSPEISSIFANPGVSSTPSVYTPSLRPNIHALAQYAQTVPVSHSETELESNLNQDMGGIKNYTDFENTKRQKMREEEERREEQERQMVLKIAEENRIKQLQEQERAKQAEIFRKQIQREQHEKNEVSRLQQEKQAWFNTLVANMDAAINQGASDPRKGWQYEWNRHFSVSPSEIINNPKYSAIQDIKRRWGGLVQPAYNFTPRPFVE